MEQAEKDALLADINETLVILGPNRPSTPKITRARTLLKGIKLACQTIAITPVSEGDTTVTPPPTPGPETPPIEPAPPETPPSSGGGGGSTSPPTTTTVVTTYTSQGDFGGVQGYRGWSYLSEDETEMTYSATTNLWSGTETYQGIWSTGQHPGATNGAMRRWTAQATGTYAITGQILDADISASGNDVTVTFKKNGTAIYGPQTITSGDSTGYAITGVTGNCTLDDTFDFLVEGVGGISYASTGLTVSIALTTTTTTGSGSTTQTTLPFTLNGTAPEEGTYTITANKPSNADGCTIAITGVNLDAAYGRCYVNGSSNSVAVWATNGANTGISATVSLAIPVAYMVNGSNTLRFTHDSGAGYTITAIGTPAFTTPSTATPPATQTSLPFVLTGSILPEDAILTVSLSKPSNANGATMTVTGVNLTGEMGAYYINGTLASAIWADNPANAGVSATVTRTPNVNLFQNGNNAIRFTHTSGSGYTVSSVQVQFSTPTPVTDPGPPAGNNGVFQSEPAGMTTLLNHNFSVILGPNMTNFYNAGAIVSDATAPVSPPSVFKSAIAGRALTGGSEIAWNYPTIQRSMFVGKWWRTNPEFEGRIVANKMFFMRGPGTNGYFGMFGGPNAGNPNFYIAFGINTSGLLDANLYPNVSSGVVTRGQWTKIEAYIRCSTTRSSADGIIRWWVNGVLVGNYTGMNYCGINNEGINQWVWSETWDGHQDMGQSNTVEWAHYLDHLFISGST